MSRHSRAAHDAISIEEASASERILPRSSAFLVSLSELSGALPATLSGIPYLAYLVSPRSVAETCRLAASQRNTVSQRRKPRRWKPSTSLRSRRPFGQTDWYGHATRTNLRMPSPRAWALFGDQGLRFQSSLSEVTKRASPFRWLLARSQDTCLWHGPKSLPV